MTVEKLNSPVIPLVLSPQIRQILEITGQEFAFQILNRAKAVLKMARECVGFDVRSSSNVYGKTVERDASCKKNIRSM